MRIFSRGIVNVLAVVLAMLFSGVCAAEGLEPVSFEAYAQTVFADAEWEIDGVQQLRVLSSEEGVTVSVCMEGDNLASLTVEYPIGQPSDSVRMAIEGLGWIRAEMIEEIFSIPSEEVREMEAFSVWRIEGELREGISICRTEDAADMAWQPIHGGARIHSKPRCSGMDVSRLITEEAAQALEWKNCGKCRKNR